MAVYGIDPGSNYTGVAFMTADGYFQAVQLANPVDAFQWVKRRHMSTDTVLLEDYTHGGMFTREAKETLKVVGFMDYGLRLMGVEPVVRNKSQRLSGVSEARELIQDKYPDLSEPEYKDALSALAHVITWRRTNG